MIWYELVEMFLSCGRELVCRGLLTGSMMKKCVGSSELVSTYISEASGGL